MLLISQGLSDKHALNVLERDGPNLVTLIKPKKDINLFKGLAIYLWITAAAFFSLYTYNVFEYNEAHVEYLIFGIISLIAIGIYAVFSHVQEINLKHVQSNFCIRNQLDNNKLVKVIRDGKYKEINSEQLVVGDIVYLEHSNYDDFDLLLSFKSLKV
jgi:magnesium-transporting ATPase (P-type)